MGKLLQKNIGNPLQKISNSLFYNCDTLPHQKTLTRLGKTSHENTPPCKSGGFHLKGYEMKKYIPLDFDEKGKVILGNAKNTPTPNGTIPAIFIPGGSDENKQGLKSISISPAIQTAPALDSLFPIYWDDLPEGEVEDGVEHRGGEYTLHWGSMAKGGAKAGGDNPQDGDQYTTVITPSSDWCILHTDDTFGSLGEPYTTTIEVFKSKLSLDIAVYDSTKTKCIAPFILITE